MPKRKRKTRPTIPTGTWAVVRDDGIVLGNGMPEKRARRMFAEMPADVAARYVVKDLRGRRTIRLERG